MADSISVTTPVISSATWTPNPASVGATAKIAVKITETTKTIYPMPFASGEISSGSV